jgi:hypothetical protein
MDATKAALLKTLDTQREHVLGIEEYRVRPGRVSAGVIVLAVSGRWSNIAEPGVLLCSDEFLGLSELFLPAL